MPNTANNNANKHTRGITASDTWWYVNVIHNYGTNLIVLTTL